jgi:hypothetical protein
MRHRKLRHHLAGIEQARKLGDDQSAAAARLHIMADLKQAGWTEEHPFLKIADPAISTFFFSLK